MKLWLVALGVTILAGACGEGDRAVTMSGTSVSPMAAAGTSASANVGGTIGNAGGESHSGVPAAGGMGGAGGNIFANSSGGAPASFGGSASVGTAGVLGVGGTTGSQFRPCPTDGSACVVLPFGDSITEGVGSEDGGGYRAPLFHSAHQAGKQLSFVGSAEGGPETVDGVLFPSNHEGHGGYTIEQLIPIAQSTIQGFNPHVVLLMIGTNNIGPDDPRATPLPRRLELLGQLLDSICLALPNSLVVVAQIVPTNDVAVNTEWIEPYNAALPQLISERVATGKHLLLVDMYHPFTSNQNFALEYMWNFKHPNDAGYKVMGDTWYAALASLLP